MQTIELDLAMRRIVPLLHAKQNDVGKKVAVVLTDNGAAYSIPGDAVFSVWYSGASGEGNYTTIDGRSAFSVSGNTVTVELITQMLQNKGPGQLCLVMNKADGTQLGLWNIPYFVEEIPGAGSQEATAYYTAFTKAIEDLPYPDTSLTVPNKAADSKTVGDYLRRLTNQVAVERARIDQLVALQEGSTTGDAELADIRVGADRVTYGSAGSAVRSQLNNKADLLELMSLAKTEYIVPDSFFDFAEGWFYYDNSYLPFFGNGNEFISQRFIEFGRKTLRLRGLYDGCLVRARAYDLVDGEYVFDSENSYDNAPAELVFETIPGKCYVISVFLAGGIPDGVTSAEMIEVSLLNDNSVENLSSAETVQKSSAVMNSLKYLATNNITVTQKVNATAVQANEFKYEINEQAGHSFAYSGIAFKSELSGKEYLIRLTNNGANDLPVSDSFNTGFAVAIGSKGFNFNYVERMLTEPNLLKSGESILIEFVDDVGGYLMLGYGGDALSDLYSVAIEMYEINENTTPPCIADGLKDTANISRFISEYLENEDISGYLAKYLNGDPSDKTLVVYGDSLMQAANVPSAGTWGGVIMDRFAFKKYVGVGIGGTGFTHGSTNIAFPDGFANGDSFPGVFFLGNPAGSEPCAFCDWNRIDKTIPEDADIILVGTGVNNLGFAEGDVSFVEGDTTDAAWANSDHYSEYNGDFNIKAVRGAVASTIMKIQCKAPHAKIFMINWANSRGEADKSNATATNSKDAQLGLLKAIAEVCNEFGVELIDMFGISGINPLNRSKFVQDGIHLNSLGYTTRFAPVIIRSLDSYLQATLNIKEETT